MFTIIFKNTRLFEFKFINDTNSEDGIIFIVERKLIKAINWANDHLQKENYDYRVSKKDLIFGALWLEKDDTVGIYEVNYPNRR